SSVMASKSAQWLQVELDSGSLLLLDCRPHRLYQCARIETAISLAIPGILLRRFRKGNLPIRAVIPNKEDREKFLRRCRTDTVLLYDESSVELQQCGSVLALLLQKLRADGCQAFFLEGGFVRFQTEYPEHCETFLDISAADSSPSLSVLGLGSLCLGSDGESDRDPCSSNEDSPLSRSQPAFPIQILPYLYLGCAKDSANRDVLSQHNIKYILNVTPNLPNVFEHDGHFRYKQIPIADHWSQNLCQFFPEAISFIDGQSETIAHLLLHSAVLARLLPTGRCPQDAAHRTLPTGRCPQDAAHRTLPTGRCPQDAVVWIALWVDDSQSSNEARSQQCGVLVHCLAGISRSVTVTVAYLMQKLSLPLNDAYDLVKRKKSDISPNFNFMGQLLDFERALRVSGPVEGQSSRRQFFFTAPTSAQTRTPTGPPQSMVGIILSTAVTLTWWWCVSVCGAGLEHPHTVPADGAVGVEVEGHQAFWTCDNKPFILVLTTVPPHTDSLGVSTKTKAGLVTEDDPLPF
ncbi:hypothetical protein NFI96_026251, partial [Prochilodus magdalenae]